MWHVDTSKDFEKFLSKHRDIAPKILQILRTLAIDPYNNSLDIKRIINKPACYYRVRVGQYRLVYKLITTDKTIFFEEADARGGIYKNKK